MPACPATTGTFPGSWLRWGGPSPTSVPCSLPMGTPTTSALRSGSAANNTSRCRSMRPTLLWPAARSPNPAKGFGPIKLGPLLGFLWFTVRRGGLRVPKLHEVATFGDEATLDAPGSPRVILTPGHTPGSAVLHVASRNVLFVGDALATYAVTTGARGPQVAPF